MLVEQFGYWEQDHGTADVDQFLHQIHIGDSLSKRLRKKLAAQAELEGVSPETHPAEPDESAPQQIDRYRIERELGSGSFGRVYLATDTELQRSVAVKIPTRQHINDVGGAQAFLDEARIAAAIDASGIVPVYDVGVTESGTCYVVSRYLDGGTLAERISKQMSHNDAIEMVMKLARSLHEAHRTGIVHRDIKPANILIDGDGSPWITDFGLALKERDLRARNEFIGTPALSLIHI